MKKINSSSINDDNKKTDGPPKLWWPDKYVKDTRDYSSCIVKERKQRSDNNGKIN